MAEMADAAIVPLIDATQRKGNVVETVGDREEDPPCRAGDPREFRDCSAVIRDMLEDRDRCRAAEDGVGEWQALRPTHHEQAPVGNALRLGEAPGSLHPFKRDITADRWDPFARGLDDRVGASAY